MPKRLHTILMRGAMMAISAVAIAGCSKNPATSTTTPSTTTPTAADASVTESFNGTVPVGGASFFSFTVGAYGTVDLTLTSIGGSGVPSTVWVGLGIGTPSGQTCPTSTSVDTQAGTAIQVTGTYDAGVYCADVFDIGNLAAPAQFSVTIAHP
jgi:hypothetical protein